MLGTKLACVFAVTLLVLLITADNEAHAAPEPCGETMSSYYKPHKKPEKFVKPKEDKGKMEKGKKKELMKKFEKMLKFLGM